MKTLILAVWTMTAAGARADDAIRPAVPECSERELDAMTPLPDGTVAGERQALQYFKGREPDVDKALSRLEPGPRRARFGKYFMWFQRVGNCRKRQKAEMIRQIKGELRAGEIVEEYRRAKDSTRRAALRDMLASALEEQLDSELQVMSQNLANLRGAIEDFRRELSAAEEEFAQRREARSRMVAARVNELLGER